MSGGQSWEEEFEDEDAQQQGDAQGTASAADEEERPSCPLCMEELVRAQHTGMGRGVHDSYASDAHGV